MAHFSILLGGDVTATDRLRKQVASTRVIAADSGMRHAAALGVMPELWLGDFDSSDADLQQRYADVPRETFPAAKDATDGDLAITEALRRGAETVILVGALGGRFDHLMATGMMMLTLHKRDIVTWMTSGKEEVYPLMNCALKTVPVGTVISIIPTTPIAGLQVSGVQWPLQNTRLPVGTSLTLSNVTTGIAEIALNQGEGFITVQLETA
jgi:thiamine pyrophosphokinase